jgi:hypothetical protein
VVWVLGLEVKPGSVQGCSQEDSVQALLTSTLYCSDNTFCVSPTHLCAPGVQHVLGQQVLGHCANLQGLHNNCRTDRAQGHRRTQQPSAGGYM